MTKKSKAVATTNNAEKVNTQVVLKSLEKQSLPLIRKLDGLAKIKTNEDYTRAIEVTKELKALGKLADAQLKTITDPLKQASDAARAIFKPFLTKLVDVEANIKAALLEYQEGLDKKKLKLNESFESGDIKKASTYVKKSAELENDSNVRRVYQLIMLDESKTPRAFLTPDLDKIKAAFKEGKKVAGWSYEQVKTIAI